MTPRPASEALARFLAEPAHGGVYRLKASRAAGFGEAEGLHWHRLPVPHRWTREALLDALAASLAFPDYFGRNWDAAWDCLTELGWESGRAQVILLPEAPADGAAMAIFLALMSDACDHWAARGQTLAVLLVEDNERRTDVEGPPWLAAVPHLPEAALGEGD
ncbi:barstar family protein [Halomonas sp. HK25]|uniref:barstar family protein n=1 Tax=Halomonas sp. HK25 TaxID=3394321 RepID=UPI0039FBFF03